MEQLEANDSSDDGRNAEYPRHGGGLFEEHHSQDCRAHCPDSRPDCIGGAERERLHCKPEQPKAKPGCHYRDDGVQMFGETP